MTLQYSIVGQETQGLIISLAPNQSVRSEAGAMLLMTDGIEMQTKATGGAWKSLKRTMAGESFFLTTFKNNNPSPAQVIMSAPYPGKIISIKPNDFGGEFICQRDAFLCAEESINVDISFSKKIGAGFFGGEGFILQKISGEGEALIHSGGTEIKIELQAGEKLRVDTGCIVGFASSVSYDIQFTGGFKNTLFGGEGLFLATLTGPGTVYIQTMPFSKLADRLSAAHRGAQAGGNSKGILGVVNAITDSSR